MTESVRGRCLCGDVTFAAELQSHDVSACHCGMCRRQVSGPLMVVEAVGSPIFKDEASLAVYHSSEWGERGFCRTCGTALFWKPVGVDQYSLSVGTLEDQTQLHLAREIFFDDKPGFYDFANDTERLTGAQSLAIYLANQKTE